MRPRVLAVIVVLSIWLAARIIFWTGYTGSDDHFYARYAYLAHRQPINHLEFRMLSIGLMRASFLAFGPSEVSACLPSLLSSALTLLAVAWFVGWPSSCTWSSNASVLLAALLPLDVILASDPGAYAIAAGLLALGTTAMLRSAGKGTLAGALLLTLGFMAHEMSFYYIAVLCLVALGFDWRRFGAPVLLCVVLSACYLAVECAIYAQLFGDGLMRFRPALAVAEGQRIGVEAKGDTWLFFLKPLRWLALSRDLGFNLLVLFLGGALAWKHLDRAQRILLVTAAVYWLWTGYGSMVPWEYNPPSRTTRFYQPLTVAVCVIVPTAIQTLIPNRWLASAFLGLLLLVHLAGLADGGQRGQSVDTSRDLLEYARAHPRERFLTNVSTMNEMYVLNGFEMPANVVCLNGSAVEQHLLVNKEPGGPVFRFSDGPCSAFLWNHDNRWMLPEPKFWEYVKARWGATVWKGPVKYRLLYRPIEGLVEGKEFAIQSRGAEVVEIVHSP